MKSTATSRTRSRNGVINRLRSWHPPVNRPAIIRAREEDGFVLARQPWKSVLLPVETVPEHVDAIGDPLELVTAVAVSGPQVIQRGELRQIGEPVLRGFGHLHFPRQEAAIALGRVNPKSLRRLFREEPRLLACRQRAHEEARGEADGTRLRCDEVRQVSQRAQVAVPALAGDQLRERRLAGHEGLAATLDRGAGPLTRPIERLPRT